MAEFVVTTSRKPNSDIQQQAADAAEELGVAMVRRRGHSIGRICADEGVRAVLVIESDRQAYYIPDDDIELFFHPNMAPMRLRNLKGDGRDHLVEAMELREGDAVLDCTLGFAAEAILCAHIVTESGRVVGLESSPVIAYLTRRGLQEGEFVSKQFTATMRRIEVQFTDYNDYLPTCETNAFDVVYFDPLFDRPPPGSESMVPLRAVADDSNVSEPAVEQARRVARRCVVVKQRADSSLWQQIPVDELRGGSSSEVEYGVVNAREQ